MTAEPTSLIHRFNDRDLTAAEIVRLRLAASALLESLKDTLRMLEAAHRELGMYSADNPRVIKARAAIQAAEQVAG